MSVANSLIVSELQNIKISFDASLETIRQNLQEIEDDLIETNGLVETNKQDILKKTFTIVFQEQENYINQIPLNTNQTLRLLFTNITNPLIDIQDGLFSVKQNGNYLFTVNGQFQRINSNGGITFLNYRLNSSIGQIGSTQCVELNDSSTTIPFSKSFLLPVKNAQITLWFELVRNNNSTGAGRNDGGLISIVSTTEGWRQTPSIGVSCVYMP